MALTVVVVVEAACVESGMVTCGNGGGDSSGAQVYNGGRMGGVHEVVRAFNQPKLCKWIPGRDSAP